jgi:hypothetical protein
MADEPPFKAFLRKMKLPEWSGQSPGRQSASMAENKGLRRIPGFQFASLPPGLPARVADPGDRPEYPEFRWSAHLRPPRPSSLRTSMRVGLHVTVDVFPARTFE